MSTDVLIMVRKVSLYDAIVGIASTILVYAIFGEFALPLLIGLVVGMVNFIVSSIITNLLFNKFQGKYMAIYLLSFILRISLISLIGFILFTQNRYNVLAYVGGYMVHLIGVSIYSLSQKHVS